MSNRILLTLGLSLYSVVGCSPDATTGSASSDSAPLDPCVLLTAADPSAVLGEPLDEPNMVAPTMCSIVRSDAILISAGLNLTTGRNPGLTRETFFESTREGFEILGVDLEDLHEVEGIGDLTVWAEYEGGMQMWVFWDERSAIIVLSGVAVEDGLAWAENLARTLT